MATLSVAGDGVFSLNQNGYISLVDLKTNTTSNLVATADIKDVRADLASLFYLFSCSLNFHTAGEWPPYKLVELEAIRQHEIHAN